MRSLIPEDVYHILYTEQKAAESYLIRARSVLARLAMPLPPGDRAQLNALYCDCVNNTQEKINTIKKQVQELNEQDKETINEEGD